jgi:hypothetical protein
MSERQLRPWSEVWPTEEDRLRAENTQLREALRKIEEGVVAGTVEDRCRIMQAIARKALGDTDHE